MLSSSSNFFQSKRSLSEIKAELLPAYFRIWAETTASEELVLADLNAGNGLEANGGKAVALQILEAFQEAGNATETEAKTLKLFFGNPAKTNLQKLKQSLEIPEEEETRLPENIAFLNEPESQETLPDLLEKVPGLLVADPFSYDLAQEIILKVLPVKTTDLLLLFDYKKLEKAFLADNPTDFMEAIFGKNLLAMKARFIAEKSPKRKEQVLMEAFENSFRKLEFHPLVFKINPPGKAGNPAYLVLASKSRANYFRAKEWLQTYSEFQEDGVPLFGVNLNYQPAAIPGFASFLNKFSLENLTQELSGKKSIYHYQAIKEIYESHSPGTHYILANYEAAFRKLKASGRVEIVDALNKKVKQVTPASVVFYKLHGAT